MTLLKFKIQPDISHYYVTILIPSWHYCRFFARFPWLTFYIIENQFSILAHKMEHYIYCFQVFRGVFISAPISVCVRAVCCLRPTFHLTETAVFWIRAAWWKQKIVKGELRGWEKAVDAGVHFWRGQFLPWYTWIKWNIMCLMGRVKENYAFWPRWLIEPKSVQNSIHICIVFCNVEKFCSLGLVSIIS